MAQPKSLYEDNFYRAEVLRVVDGDTMELRCDLGQGSYRLDRYRLYKIDTPEVYGVKKESAEYIAGKKASAFAESLLPPGRQIWVQTVKEKGVDARGKYGRYLATILIPIDDMLKTQLEEDVISRADFPDLPGHVNFNMLMVELGLAKMANY